MSPHPSSPAIPFLLLSSCLLSFAVHAANIDASAPGIELDAQNVIATAEEETKQAPGVSVITAEDIRKRPPANDLSQIIRTMPGVNLTGNSTSGQRGNNRQIDIRGMGPENTLILVDGKPVSSRNAVRYGWRGERDSRGDTNWVPADQVERIEVIRGPAAARYGNGAAGGVVNIITKKASATTHGNATLYTSFPTHKDEGASQRLSFGLNGPLTDSLSYRVYGNVAKTESDDWDINSGHESARTGNQAGTLPAGREGVRNKDVNGLLSWNLTPEQTLELETGFSRQGNLYTGDTQNTNSNATVKKMLGHETNRTFRETYALTHRGDWDFGSSLAYLQYEKTRNNRINEGLAGGTEGIFANSGYYTAVLRDLTAHGELNLPLDAGLPQTLTLGSEWTRQQLDDPSSNTQTTTEGGAIGGLTSSGRDTTSEAQIFSLFAEDNIELAPGTMLTPGLRFDHHDIVGNNWSPSLNLQPWPGLLRPDHQLLPARQREPRRRNQRQQGAGHRVQEGRPGRRPDLVPQRLQEQDRVRHGRHRQRHRRPGGRRRELRQCPHLPVGERAQGAGGRPGRQPHPAAHRAADLDQQPHLDAAVEEQGNR